MNFLIWMKFLNYFLFRLFSIFLYESFIFYHCYLLSIDTVIQKMSFAGRAQIVQLGKYADQESALKVL